MVRLHVKHGEESQFLFDTTTTVEVEQLVQELVHLYNGRLKVERICLGMIAIVCNNVQLKEHNVDIYFCKICPYKQILSETT